jgi:hypothetical protein
LWGKIVITLDIEICVIGKHGTKKGVMGKVVGGSDMGFAKFCGLSECLSVFLLL